MTVHDIDPGFPPEVWPDHWREVKERGSFVIESHHRAKDGQIFPVEITVNYVEFEGNEYNCAFAHDITERKRAEKALRESEEQFRNIIESIPVGMHMYQLEPDGSLIFAGANPAADDILGVDNSQFVRKTIEQAFPALADTEVPEKYRLAASRGEAWSTDQIMYEENQIVGAFEIQAFQTSPGRMVAAFVDITERKQVNEALRQSEERYRQLFEAESDAIFLIENESGRILEANSAASVLYGYSREELLTKRNTDLSAEPEDTRQVTRETPVVVDQVVTIPLRLISSRDHRSLFRMARTAGSHRGDPRHLRAQAGGGGARTVVGTDPGAGSTRAADHRHGTGRRALAG
jgi:PAS domain S-box-containing protein